MIRPLAGKPTSRPSPEECFDTPWRRVALEDLLLRRASRQASRFSRQAKGSGKSGVLAVACPGQEVLERTGCQVRGGTTLRVYRGKDQGPVRDL